MTTISNALEGINGGGCTPNEYPIICSFPIGITFPEVVCDYPPFPGVIAPQTGCFPEDIRF